VKGGISAGSERVGLSSYTMDRTALTHTLLAKPVVTPVVTPVSDSS